MTPAKPGAYFYEPLKGAWQEPPEGGLRSHGMFSCSNRCSCLKPEDYLSLAPPPMASPTRFHSSKTTLGAAVEAFFADP